MRTCSTARSITMLAGCARKSNLTPKIRAILKPSGEAGTFSRWTPNWRERPHKKEKSRMRMKFWPNTLAVQLILVVTAAVTISSIGVAAYFYENSEKQARNFSNERMIDRAVAVAATVSQVPPQLRLVVMRFMSQPNWRFRVAKGGYDITPMTAEEAAVAKRLADALP